jgi:hypothetical protein
VDYRDKIMELEQSLEQCLEKRMDGSCRSHPPVEDQLLIWSDGKTYDPTTHTIKSRIAPAYNVTLKQGLVFSSEGAGCLNYGVRNLITGSTTKMRWQFKLNTVAGAGTVRRVASEHNTVGNKRGWQFYILNTTNIIRIVLGNSDGTANAVDSAIGTYVPATGDLVDITFNSGIITCVVNGTTTYTLNVSATQTVVYNNGANLDIGGGSSGTSASYNGSLCCFKIWVDNILDTDTPKFVAPMGDKQGIDLISGTIPAVVGTVDMTARDDEASYDCEDNGFAVKDGDIYPKNYAGTGYAGLVGEPDATYQGLIATKGQIEIAGQGYLKTLFDFEQTPNTVIEDAGISWDDWDNTDCNDDEVGTAETDLDTSYYSAITASLMTCEGMLYGGTSNVANRLFFRVTSKVMKADGTFLAESGTVTDILVYKRDLTADEMIRVLKWCRALPFTSVDLVVDGEGNFVVVDGNLTYACLGV